MMAIFTVYINDSDLNEFLIRVDETAQKVNRTRSSFIRTAIEAAIEEIEYARVVGTNANRAAVINLLGNSRKPSPGNHTSPTGIPASTADTGTTVVLPAVGYIRPVTR